MRFKTAALGIIIFLALVVIALLCLTCGKWKPAEPVQPGSMGQNRYVLVDDWYESVFLKNTNTHCYTIADTTTGQMYTIMRLPSGDYVALPLQYADGTNVMFDGG